MTEHVPVRVTQGEPALTPSIPLSAGSLCVDADSGAVAPSPPAASLTAPLNAPRTPELVDLEAGGRGALSGVARCLRRSRDASPLRQAERRRGGAFGNDGLRASHPATTHRKAAA